MTENGVMALLREANPVRVDDLPQIDFPDSIIVRRCRPSRRLALALVVVAVALAASLIGVFVFGGHRPRPVVMTEGLPGRTVQHPLAGANQASLSDATAALGPALVLPDTDIVGPSDAGPVWMFAGRNFVNVAVTFPRQGMFIDYVWPGANSGDPLDSYRALVQDNRPNFHLIDLNGVPGFAIDQNSDDTGHNFGVVAFTVGSTEIQVFGHNDQTTLTAVATSILDQMPSSARATPRTSSDSISLEDIPIALHAPAIPPDTSAVQPSEAAPLAATDCPTGAHTSNPACEVTVAFPSQGLTVRYSRPAPADPEASYQEVAQRDTDAKVVSLDRVPALFVNGRPSSIELVAGGTDVTVRGSYDETALRAIAESILDRSRS
jgi:hypothetical protein